MDRGDAAVMPIKARSDVSSYGFTGTGQRANWRPVHDFSRQIGFLFKPIVSFGVQVDTCWPCVLADLCG
jgi:hypothetical protein